MSSQHSTKDGGVRTLIHPTPAPGHRQHYWQLLSKIRLYHHNTLVVFTVFGASIILTRWPFEQAQHPQHPQVAVRYLQSCLPNLEDGRRIRSIRQWKSLSKLVESAALESIRNLVELLGAQNHHPE